MAADRTGFVFTNANTMAATNNALMFGVCLSSNITNASLTIYNVDSSAAPNFTDRVLVLQMGAATGTMPFFPPVPAYCENGLYCSLSSGAVATVFFTNKT